MIRRVSFIRRKDGQTREEFERIWTGEHAAIVRQVPGIRGIRFSMIDHLVPTDIGWDGVGETWFDEIATEADDLAADVRARCLAMPDPELLDTFDRVYAEQTPYLAEQKAGYAAYLDTFDDQQLDAAGGAR